MKTTNENGEITYEYDCVFKIGITTSAKLEIINNSIATEGSTSIRTQKKKNFNIPNDDSATIAILGTGKDLYGKVVISSEFDNVSNKPDDEIKIQYSINGTLIVDHSNPVSEQPRPIITIIIKFIAP